jgi:hydroxyacylglutathione hydrolase
VNAPDEITPGVFVVTAAMYTTTTTVVAGADGGCLLIDPAVSAADLAALAAWLTGRGLHPVAGWSTHPHWDHLLWSAALGPAPRYATPRAAAFAARTRAALTEEVEQEAPGHDLALFAQVEPLDGDEIDWPGPRAAVYRHDGHAPGHGAVFLPEAGVLITGDMCSDIETPLLDLDAGDPFGRYRAGLGLLAGVPGVRLAVPGHGQVAADREFRRRVTADLAYLDAVEAGTDIADARLTADWLRAAHAKALAFARAPGGGGDPGDPGGELGAGPLKEEDRDEPVGLLLVLRVRREGRDRPLPPGGALVAGDLAGRHLPRARPVLHHYLRVLAQVVHPDGVLGGAALGADRRVDALVLDPHQRSLAHRPGPGAPVGDNHHRQAGLAQRRSRRPAGPLVLFHLIPDPGRRARHVITVDRHVLIQHCLAAIHASRPPDTRERPRHGTEAGPRARPWLPGAVPPS